MGPLPLWWVASVTWDLCRFGWLPPIRGTFVTVLLSLREMLAAAAMWDLCHFSWSIPLRDRVLERPDWLFGWSSIAHFLGPQLMTCRSPSSEAVAIDWIASGGDTLLQAKNLPAYPGLRSSIREVTGSKGLSLLDAANGTSLTMRLQFQSYEPTSAWGENV